MNMTKRISVLAIFSAFALPAMAQSTGSNPAPADSPPTHNHKMMHHHMMMHDRPFLMVVHQLDPTADQRKQIHALIEKSEAQQKSSMMDHQAEFSGLMNPGDANYASAVQAAKDAAVARIEMRSQDNMAIYNLLTAEQKAKIPQVLDQMKQHMNERKHEHREDHGQQPDAHDHAH